MFIVVSVVDSGIIICMIADCLSTNTPIATTIDKNFIRDYHLKMVSSLLMRNITTGLERPTQPDVGPPVGHKVTQMGENPVSNVMIKRAGKKQEPPLIVNDNTQLIASSGSLSVMIP